MRAPDETVGQHFVVDFSGTEITPALERLIRQGRIGGVILFAKNVASPGQVRTLTADLQRLAAAAGLPPLLISVDQEGGFVNRLESGCTVFPSAMAIGASGRPEDAAAAGRITARELRALGINTNHAPVLDVNSHPHNPVINARAFGDDPAAVAALGCAYLAAARAEGVLATVKHFPGHGATPLDSHVALPVVDKDLSALSCEDLYPFGRAFAAGADAVMAAHIVYPALDPRRPASLAPAVMRDLLRGQMGFSGIALTDSLAMQAVAARWTPGEATVAALAAGVDVVMVLGGEPAQWEALRAAGQAVSDGTLGRRALRESAERIARIKSAYQAAEISAGPVGSRDHLQTAQAVADRAVTLVRSVRGAIPLPAGRTAVVHVGGDGWRARTEQFVRLLIAAGADAALVPVEQAADGPWRTVVAASHPWQRTPGAGTIPDLQARWGDRLIVVGFGAPYELMRFPQVGTYLAAYGPDPPSLSAAARVLTGALAPAGRLPVAIAGLHPRGHRVEA